LAWCCLRVWSGFWGSYIRQHEEFRFLERIVFGLWWMFLMVPSWLRGSWIQQNLYRKYGLMALFVIFGLWWFGSAWDDIGTSDLRYCLGQTYFQRVPVESRGCDIIKAIPTPRYFAGRKCPTADLFAGCESDYPWSWQSYNQRKAEGIVSDDAPLPWRPKPEAR